MPDPLVDSLGRRLIEALLHEEKPEPVDHPVVPEKELRVGAQLRGAHAVKKLRVHNPYPYNFFACSCSAVSSGSVASMTMAR